MRYITQEGLDLIKRFEGFSPTIYICPGGYPTIGYGHVVKKHEVFSNGINEVEAENLFRQDAGIAERLVLRLIHVSLTNGQFDALVSFTFNFGGGALQINSMPKSKQART